MDVAATFFVSVLAVQLGFTGVLIWLVARRFPARLPLYRFVAPAAVPALLLAIALYSYAAVMRAAGGAPETMIAGRLVLAYAVLWLAGVLFATMVIRWVRR